MPNLLDLPAEVLTPICRLLVVKNSGSGRCLDLRPIVFLNYFPSPGTSQHRPLRGGTYYNAEIQVLRVCRRLHDVAADVVYGEHRFVCHQTDDCIRLFAQQIGQANLAKIELLHLNISREYRLSAEETPEALIEFLVSQMPGLKSLKLSKRWKFHEYSDDTFREQRALMLWLGQQLLRNHSGLKHGLWTEKATRHYPDEDDSDPLWMTITVTLSNLPPTDITPFRSGATEKTHLILDKEKLDPVSMSDFLSNSDPQSYRVTSNTTSDTEGVI